MPETEIRVFCEANGESPFIGWLSHLEKREPRAYAKCLQRILLLAEHGYDLRRPNADLLRDGVYELRTRVGRRNHRILYGFTGRCVATLSHGITKESEVPSREIDLAIKRLKLAKDDPDTYTTLFED
jgi:hypothetical protein